MVPHHTASTATSAATRGQCPHPELTAADYCGVSTWRHSATLPEWFVLRLLNPVEKKKLSVGMYMP